MNILVVYESMYGNTRRIAETITSVLRAEHDVALAPAAEVRTDMIAGCDLLVIGAPTHAHGLPSASSRESAVKQGVATSSARSKGVRELLEGLPGGQGKLAAVFDTRLKGPRWMWGAASPVIARSLERAGFRLLLPPQAFFIRGVKSPHLLADGEVEGAAAWGGQIARAAAQSRVPESV